MKKRNGIIIGVIGIILMFALNCSLVLGVHTFEVIADEVAPAINLTSPVNGASYPGSSYNFNFDFNVTDDNLIGNCSVYVNTDKYRNTSAIVKGARNTIVVTLLTGTYTSYVNCTDIAGNTGNSSWSVISVTTPAGTSSSGSGGSTSSFWINTINVDKEIDLNKGYNKNLKSRERVKINILNSVHYVGVISISSSSAVIHIASTPKNVTFNIGDEKKFELNNDNYYDLYVRLNDINNNNANLSIKSIYEKIIEETSNITQVNEEVNEKEATTEKPISEETKKNVILSKINIIIYSLVILIFIVIILLIFLLKKKKNKRKKIKLFY